jgi:hypothetical protein
MSRLSRARDKLKRMALQPLPALKAAGERGAHGCRDETNETKQACLGFPVSLFASVNTLQLASFPKQSMSSNPGNHSGKAAHEFRQAKS